jgi:hypothetical protein
MNSSEKLVEMLDHIMHSLKLTENKTHQVAAAEFIKTIEDIDFVKFSFDQWMKFLANIDTKNRDLRELFVRKFAWAMPNRRVLNAIAKYCQGKTVLEVNAGNGLWSYLLKMLDVNIKVTDIKPWEKTYTEIETMDGVNSVRTYPTDVLITIWPPFQCEQIAQTLQQFKGDTLIYLGEDRQGCTGSQEFFDELESNWELKEQIKMRNWRGLFDAMYVYVRKEVKQN